MQITCIGKIIEGALSGNRDKVLLYSKTLAQDLADDGNFNGAKIIRSKINEDKTENLISLD